MIHVKSCIRDKHNSSMLDRTYKGYWKYETENIHFIYTKTMCFTSSRFEVYCQRTDNTRYFFSSFILTSVEKFEWNDSYSLKYKSYIQRESAFLCEISQKGKELRCRFSDSLKKNSSFCMIDFRVVHWWWFFSFLFPFFQSIINQSIIPSTGSLNAKELIQLLFQLNHIKIYAIDYNRIMIITLPLWNEHVTRRSILYLELIEFSGTKYFFNCLAKKLHVLQ